MMALTARAGVVLESTEKVNRKPDVASVGGFTVVAGEKEIIFDWCMYEGQSAINEDGKLNMGFYLRDFDTDFFNESNEGLTAPDWEQMLNGVIEEVYHEVGFIEDDQENLIDMKVLEFEIYLWDDQGKEYQTLKFSPEQIEAYNKKVEAEK